MFAAAVGVQGQEEGAEYYDYSESAPPLPVSSDYGESSSEYSEYDEYADYSASEYYAYDGFTCPDGYKGFYPHGVSCDKYWACDDGETELRTCGNGLAYDDTDLVSSIT